MFKEGIPIRELVKVGILFVLLITGAIFFTKVVATPDFRSYVATLGPIGPLAVILYIVASHVFAPIAGAPGFLVGIGLYGITTASLYLYIAGLISSAINFGIARWYGRELVLKFVGEQSMQQIDQLITKAGDKVLILTRLVGFSFFDIVSYAFGLTNMTFRKFYTITAIASLVPTLFIATVYQSVDFTSEIGFFIWMGTLVFAGIVFSFIIKRYVLEK